MRVQAEQPLLPSRPILLPSTPVGRQLEWLCSVASGGPVPSSELRAHTTLPSLTLPAGLRVESFRARPRRAERAGAAVLRDASGQRHHLKVITDAAGRIDSLWLTPIPRSWGEIGERMRALAPDTSFLATEVLSDSAVAPVYGVEATARRPIGSAVALYVLGALAHGVDAGRLSWDEPLAVRDDWKTDLSSSTGVLPDGTMLTLRRYADDAIFTGDASAIDHLIGRLGRGAVEAQQVRFGHTQVGANLPFLTTREVVALKAHPWMGAEYVATDDPRERLGYLRDVVAHVPRPEVDDWPDEPRLTDSVEWFASPSDICHALAGLAAQSTAQPEVGAVLGQRGTAALGLDVGRWPVGWSKDGAEPGVVTENFLARTSSGRTVAVSLMASDPKGPFDIEAARAQLLACAVAAFGLLAAE
ncbi:serine hydrolase [Cryptosporangium phraense]|uniref:Serine hydrolase n=1 Tax=Cryptosporangium phraense TaxID=2593070 RepID=A0A545AKN9_9ACTN|nr:serine hydrolase [Cryptosporangium phraense]TQS41841.1 serine hydrolase [Cryptosporangium phraense]